MITINLASAKRHIIKNHNPYKIAGIYIITNILNCREYVGSAVNVYNRWTRHIIDLNKNKHHSRFLQRCWNKYGKNMFKFEIAEVIENPTKELLIEKEQLYLDKLNPDYNCCKIANSLLGCKQSPEHIAKKKIIFLGERNPMFGRTQSEEARKKISERLKGKTAWNKGTKTGPEPEHVRKKKSASMRGIKKSPEHIAKIVASNKRTKEARLEALKNG